MMNIVHQRIDLPEWQKHEVVKKIEQTNREMQATVEDNKTKIDDVLALKNKRQEYEEVVIKAKRAQRITAHKLESEIQKLKDDLMETTEKLTSLEKILGKRLSGTKDSNVKVSDVCEEDTESSEKIVRDSLEDIKVLEPSFPPTATRRKYGISVPRAPKNPGAIHRVGFK